MSSIIEFKDISKHYSDSDFSIDNFNLSVEKGDFVTMIGGSGCGKTTILKMINGLITPDRGSVIVNGKDVSESDIVELRRRIGYAIQGTMLFPHLNVRENIAYVPNLIHENDSEKTDEAIDKWLDIVGLDSSILSRYPHELSGGQQQRVGIARALAASPAILLMDEPFSAVDEITRTQLQKEMKEIQEKYRSNPERLNQETIELYKREKMGPFSGCLSGILQIVIILSVFWLVSKPLTYMKKLIQK